MCKHSNISQNSLGPKLNLLLAQNSVQIRTMSDALLTSTAVFKSRAAEIGLEPAAITAAIDENIGSLGQFGFSTAFMPGIA